GGGRAGCGVASARGPRPAFNPTRRCPAPRRGSVADPRNWGGRVSTAPSPAAPATAGTGGGGPRARRRGGCGGGGGGGDAAGGRRRGGAGVGTVAGRVEPDRRPGRSDRGRAGDLDRQHGAVVDRPDDPGRVLDHGHHRPP